MKWDSEVRILEEKKDYKISYMLYSSLNGLFEMVVYFEDYITTDIYYQRQMYYYKTVPVSMKEIEEELRKLLSKLLTRIKK